MDKLFPAILSMSITGAFVIAAVILARLPLKKAPKIISYCLWAVVGFRLICPISFESAVSLIPFEAQQIPDARLLDENISFPATMGAVNQAVGDIANGGLGIISITTGREPDGTRIITQALHHEFWLLFFSKLWVPCVLVMLLYGIVSYALLKRRMRTAIRIEGNIYEADNIQTPFVLGIIKPKIYLPLSLAAGERDYIILHERTHIRRHDHIVKFAAYFILCLHWFNPLVWVAFLLMGVDMEMSCDERVLKEMGGETKHDYSRSLLSLATERRVIGGSPLAFGEGGVKERVKNVLNFKKPSWVIVIAAVALVAVLSIGFAVNRAAVIDIPDAEAVLYVTMDQINEYTSIGEVTVTDKGEIGQILNALSGARKTWRSSVNDYPKENNYLVVRLHLSNEMRTLCLYTDGTDYIEEPYVGIYRPKTKFNYLYSVYSAYGYEAHTVSIIVWKDADNQTKYSLFDGDVTPAPSELSSGRVFRDIAGLNDALAEYPQDTLSMVRVGHTMDFTKDEMLAITDMFVIPSGNYSMPTGLYEFQFTTLDEAQAIVSEHYPGWPDPEVKETKAPHVYGYFTDPVQAIKAELEADGCVIYNVFAVDWIVEQSASESKDYEVVTIYAEYLDAPFSDAIYMMNYTMRRPADDNTAEWKHGEPVFWDGIAYGVAKYAAEQYYAETERTAKITDMKPAFIDDYTAYVPRDKQNWQTVAFSIGYEDDPKSHPQHIAVLISQDGQSRWQVVYWSGITLLE